MWQPYMHTMNAIVQNLLKLQTLEFSDHQDEKTAAQMTELRAAVPTPILGHYDRLRARDKKGVAVVRNQTCTGCHMRIPIGQITILMRDEDLQLCESCGRYLYLAPEAPAPAPAPVAAAPAKPAPKPRKRKAAAPAA